MTTEKIPSSSIPISYKRVGKCRFMENTFLKAQTPSKIPNYFDF